MADFSELRQRISMVEAQEEARVRAQQEQLLAHQQAEARIKAERGEKIQQYWSVVAPALRRLAIELGLKDGEFIEKHDVLNVSKEFPSGGRSSLAMWRIAELTFKKPPASAPHAPKCGIIFGLDSNSRINLFVSTPKPWLKESEVAYHGDPAWMFDASGPWEDSRRAEIREQFDTALARAMEEVLK